MITAFIHNASYYKGAKTTDIGAFNNVKEAADAILKAYYYTDWCIGVDNQCITSSYNVSNSFEDVMKQNWPTSGKRVVHTLEYLQEFPHLFPISNNNMKFKEPFTGKPIEAWILAPHRSCLGNFDRSQQWCESVSHAAKWAKEQYATEWFIYDGSKNILYVAQGITDATNNAITSILSDILLEQLYTTQVINDINSLILIEQPVPTKMGFTEHVMSVSYTTKQAKVLDTVTLTSEAAHFVHEVAVRFMSEALLKANLNPKADSLVPVMTDVNRILSALHHSYRVNTEAALAIIRVLEGRAKLCKEKYDYESTTNLRNTCSESKDALYGISGTSTIFGDGTQQILTHYNSATYEAMLKLAGELRNALLFIQPYQF
jgi:hypothetical protein